MAGKNGMRLNGYEFLAGNLLKVSENIDANSLKYLEMLGGKIETDSHKLCPVDTGELRSRSFNSTGTDDDGSKVVVVGYEADAGTWIHPNAKAYAVFVHENLQARHRNGQAKFLETAFQKNKDEFLKVARAVMSESMRT